ncbi:MAG: Uma2 family endonuclease [Dehalococcoidia bacterium]
MSALAVLDRPETWPTLPDREGYEHVDGKWVKLNVAAGPVHLGYQLVNRLNAFANPHGLGWALIGETPYQIWPEHPQRYRKPDGSFLGQDALPDGVVPEGFVHAVPAIVIEVISPGDRAHELIAKVGEYLDAGIELVWVLSPATAVVTVHRPGGNDSRLRPGDTLTGEDVLPGFSLPVADLFSRRLA